MEQHHHRLSQLLRYPSENPPATSTLEPEVQAASEKPLSMSVAVAELRASKSDLGPRSSSPLRYTPGLQHPRRLPPRDLSSSIASNLASARGIRATYTRQPISPSISAQQAPGTLEALPRRDAKRPKVPSIPEYSQPSWLPPTQGNQRKTETQTSLSPTAETLHNNDEGFSRFYNNFEKLLSNFKLSAPLVFAALPLTSEEPTPSTSGPAIPSKGGVSKPKERTGSDPDVTKYISRAALKASARDGHSGNDSFYVVPTTGHTVSYAHILSFDQKEKRRIAASMHSENPDLFPDPNDEDDFVDARETPMPTSPSFSRRGSGRKMSSREMENKIEELDTENKSLKDCIDKLSKRLHAFEMAAQGSGMALQESMRMYRPASPARVDIGKSGEEALKRIRELEDHVALGQREMERLGKENEKLKNVVARYRDRWEKLKEGAKTRREGGKEAQGKKHGDAGTGNSVAG